MSTCTFGVVVRVVLVGTLLLAGCAPAGQSSSTSASPTPAGSVIFFTNQFKPVEEQAKMQDAILKDAPLKVDYIPEDPGPFNDRLNAEQKAGKVTVSLIGGLHGDLEPFVRAGYLEDLTPLAQKLSGRGISSGFMDLTHIGDKSKTLYIPWMQATYVMAVNKKALQYLPSGADVNTLTYQQLKDWGAAMTKATNKRLIGFPAGPNGLLQRFFQG